MFTTFLFFFSSRGKELYILTAAFDVLCLCAIFFSLGRHSSLLWLVLEAGFIGVCDVASRRYFAWREKKRVLWRDGGQKTTFPLTWMCYTDFWCDILGYPMSVVYLALLIVGKLSTFLFAV